VLKEDTYIAENFNNILDRLIEEDEDETLDEEVTDEVPAEMEEADAPIGEEAVEKPGAPDEAAEDEAPAGEGDSSEENEE
ncbi:MAG: hypothetical protein IKS63_04495, partial [Firmicutes bacterium]|nr:hypothetical protein [Bacillota bacterium]